jgi:anthranilate synthase/aminodeoxychorismate synthase-like glutamine amidotransferase
VKIALIDNFDSFTHNIADLIFRVSGHRPAVFRNNALTYREFLQLGADCVVISPGPGHPARPRDFGVCAQILEQSEKPIFGICLGHQGIGLAFGGKVDLSPYPAHGRLATISHNGMGLFEGIPPMIKVVRYHSLIVEAPLPEMLYRTAWTEDGLIMGLQHRDRNVFGVQFHPESICSEAGDTLMHNFLKLVPR